MAAAQRNQLKIQKMIGNGMTWPKWSKRAGLQRAAQNNLQSWRAVEEGNQGAIPNIIHCGMVDRECLIV